MRRILMNLLNLSFPWSRRMSAAPLQLTGLAAPSSPERGRRITRTGHSRSKVQLRILTAGAIGARGAVGVSIGTLAIGGFTPPSFGQGGEEACAFVLHLRSAYTVEHILESFPDDPCVPIMLTKIDADLLAQVHVDKIAALPRDQLNKLPTELLQQLGIAQSKQTSRSITPKKPTSRTHNRSSGSSTNSGLNSPSSAGTPSGPGPTSPY